MPDAAPTAETIPYHDGRRTRGVDDGSTQLPLPASHPRLDSQYRPCSGQFEMSGNLGHEQGIGEHQERKARPPRPGRVRLRGAL